MKRISYLVIVPILMMLFAINSISYAERDKTSYKGETTLFSEDFEGYDGYITLSKAYGRRLDDWAHGTIKKSESGTLTLDSIDYISFSVQAGNSKTGSSNTDESGFYSKIDNFKILIQ